jgi:hypothetical protein
MRHEERSISLWVDKNTRAPRSDHETERLRRPLHCPWSTAFIDLNLKSFPAYTKAQSQEHQSQWLCKVECRGCEFVEYDLRVESSLLSPLVQHSIPVSFNSMWLDNDRANGIVKRQKARLSSRASNSRKANGSSVNFSENQTSRISVAEADYESDWFLLAL